VHIFVQNTWNSSTSKKCALIYSHLFSSFQILRFRCSIFLSFFGGPRSSAPVGCNSGECLFFTFRQPSAWHCLQKLSWLRKCFCFHVISNFTADNLLILIVSDAIIAKWVVFGKMTDNISCFRNVQLDFDYRIFRTIRRTGLRRSIKNWMLAVFFHT